MWLYQMRWNQQRVRYDTYIYHCDYLIVMVFSDPVSEVTCREHD